MFIIKFASYFNNLSLLKPFVTVGIVKLILFNYCFGAKEIMLSCQYNQLASSGLTNH